MAREAKKVRPGRRKRFFSHVEASYAALSIGETAPPPDPMPEPDPTPEPSYDEGYLDGYAAGWRDGRQAGFDAAKGKAVKISAQATADISAMTDDGT